MTTLYPGFTFGKHAAATADALGVNYAKKDERTASVGPIDLAALHLHLQRANR